MSLLIVADIVPTASNAENFSRGNAKELIGEELIYELGSADYCIANLETPLASKKTPILKNGPALLASPKTAKGYQALPIHAVTLANNHIMDQGFEGFDETIQVLNQYGIHWFGAGDNINQAHKPFFIEMDSHRIGLYACAETEFSIATSQKPGANPFDPLETPDHLRDIRNKCDYMIVLYHGGLEQYRYPSPELQRRCRKMVECGADLVLCQHSHCVGCEERYLQGTIVYGQGNFLFDNCDNEFWQTGLIVVVSKNLEISYIPVVKTGKAVRKASVEETEKILSEFYIRSEEIKKDGFIDNAYSIKAKEQIEMYLYAFEGHHSLLFRILNKLSGDRLNRIRLKRHYKPDRKTEILNYIECEAHRELCMYALKEKY